MVDVLVVVGVLSVVALAIASFSNQMNKQLSQSSSSSMMGIVRDNLITLVKSNASWNRTTSKNHQMHCLSSGSQCAAASSNGNGGGLNFALYDASTNNQPYYDATDGRKGFTAQGAPCDGYGTSQNPACIFRFDLKWSALCTPPNCSYPQVSVTADLLYAGSNAPPFNLKKYSVPPVIRSAQ